MRGSGDLGLGAMDAIRTLNQNSKVSLVRPLLWARRADTVDYCRSRRTEFIVDEMNNDESFTRVKVRKQLLPLMQSFNNRIVEALSRTAGLLREDGEHLLNTADELLVRASVKSENPDDKTKLPVLDVKVLINAPAPLRRRALRQWVVSARGTARRLELVHLLAVEKLLEKDAGGKTVELPGGARVTRKRGLLHIEG
jgi:tRNA(Ile)-lysidine synthase